MHGNECFGAHERDGAGIALLSQGLRAVFPGASTDDIRAGRWTAASGRAVAGSGSRERHAIAAGPAIAVSHSAPVSRGCACACWLRDARVPQYRQPGDLRPAPRHGAHVAPTANSPSARRTSSAGSSATCPSSISPSTSLSSSTPCRRSGPRGPADDSSLMLSSSSCYPPHMERRRQSGFAP
jgi:hypothetical protein